MYALLALVADVLREQVTARARLLMIPASMGVLGVPVAFAQKPVMHDFLIHFTGDLGPTGQKAIYSALQDQDPNVLVSLSTEQQLAKARTHVLLSEALLELSLAELGLQVEFIEILLPGDPQLRMALDVFVSLPVYLDTGDPPMDQANYAAAKEAWISAHPDIYEQMVLAGSAPFTTSEHK